MFVYPTTRQCDLSVVTLKFNSVNGTAKRIRINRASIHLFRTTSISIEAQHQTLLATTPWYHS